MASGYSEKMRLRVSKAREMSGTRCEHCERRDATRAFYAIGETAPSHDRRETVVSFPLCLQCSLPPPIFLFKIKWLSGLLTVSPRSATFFRLTVRGESTFLLEVRQEVLSPQPWSVETKAVLLSPCVAALIGVWNFEDLCVCLPLPRRRARSRPDADGRGRPHLRVV